MDSIEKLNLMMDSIDITISISPGTDMRLKEMEDRIIAVDPDSTPEGEPWERTRDILIGAAIARGLDEDETDHGLRGFMWGELVPLEVTLKDRWRAAVTGWKRGR